MDNWIEEQALRNHDGFDAAMLSHYPEASDYVGDPERYFERVCEQCNYLEAVKLLDWNTIIPPTSRILDLAGGTGWLAAYLSTFRNAAHITIVDASRDYLRRNLPVSVRRLEGRIDKIRPVVGNFAPLLVDDASLDLVVVSSSLHHADSLESVLKEIYRVLVPRGRCFVLNEVPVSDVFYLRTLITSFVRILGKSLRHSYVPASPSISASGTLYDPVLGDRMYPDWFWRAAIDAAGFSLEDRIDTGMPTVKGTTGPSLVHFVCVKSPIEQ